MTLVYLAVAWLGGMVLARAVHFPWQALPVLGLAAWLGLVLWRDRATVRLGAACALMLALGAGRLLLAVPRFDERSLATYNGVGPVTLEGIVVGEPDERDAYTNLRVRAERLTLPDGSTRPVTGLVLVRTDRYPQRHYGDRVQVVGALETPPVFQAFSYRDYLARQSIYSLVRRAQVTLLAERQGNLFWHSLYACKRYARTTIAAILPEPQAALLTGILLGVDTGIPSDLMDAFAATGTSHIIAISGFNISIIAGLFAGLAERLFAPLGSTQGKRRAVWVAITGVVIYTLLVGASAAVVRAAIMGVLWLWGRYLGRATFAPASLAAAAIVMTALNPYTLWDVSFQLSFAATLGLALYTRPLERNFERALTRLTSAERARKVVGLLSEAFLVTLAATMTTTPIILYYFGRLSVVALLVNLLILPAQQGLMIWGGLATLVGMVVRPVGQAVGWIAWVFLTYTIEVVRLTARFPYASLPVRMEGWMVWAYYALLGGLTWYLAQSPERRRAVCSGFTARLGWKALAGSGGVLLVLAFGTWRTLPDGRLHVTFLDVGGDAIFIQTPSGRQVLIDGGPGATALLPHLGRRMPFWDRTLDLVVLTHPASERLGGLIAVLERYRVNMVVFRRVAVESAAYDRWLELVEAEGAAIYQGEAGLRLALDEGMEMVVLWPAAAPAGGDANDDPIVARLTYREFAVLLPGDIGAEVARELVAEGVSLESTVLKTAQQGGCNATTAEFLEAVSPQVVVIGEGGEERFDQPCANVLERLGEVQVYRTDQDGAVEIITDGTQVWVATER